MSVLIAMILCGVSSAPGDLRNYEIVVPSNHLGKGFELVTIELLTRNITRFGPEKIEGYMPAWSPDGTKLAFEVAGDIFVVNRDGSTRKNLTNTKDNGELQACWSPTGDRICYIAHPSGKAQITVAKSDGSNPVNISKNGHHESGPSWSRHRDILAFETTDGIFPNIQTMLATGSGRKRITNPNSGQELLGWSFPAWSPRKGGGIVFGGQLDNTVQLRHIDGKRKSRWLTNGGSVNSLAAWSPDGRYIAYSHFENRSDAWPGAIGDLVLFDTLWETTETLLKGSIPLFGGRACWKPIQSGRQVIPQAVLRRE